jgi:hypothetical protein
MTAFAQFAEPHAWLIRGLVEYGWVDVTPAGGHIPPNVAGGIDLSTFTHSDGRDPIRLLIPAAANGQTVLDDGTYSFTLAHFAGEAGPAFMVRCPEANYLQEFPFDPANPTWLAGYIHQALTAHVPQFAAWRLQGGELSWGQRQGIPEVQGQPASALISRFIQGLHGRNISLCQGPQSGWWLQGAPVAATPGSTPVAQGTANPFATAGQLGQGPAHGMSTADATALVQGPSKALLIQAGIGTTYGLMWVLNLISALVLGDAWGAVMFSFVAIPVLLGGGAAAAWGALKMRKLEPGLWPWAPVAYSALCGLTCILSSGMAFAVHSFIGIVWLLSQVWALPLAVWAGLTLRKPELASLRSGSAA